jgi:hypothetical protein
MLAFCGEELHGTTVGFVRVFEAHDSAWPK